MNQWHPLSVEVEHLFVNTGIQTRWFRGSANSIVRFAASPVSIQQIIRHRIRTALFCVEDWGDGGRKVADIE